MTDFEAAPAVIESAYVAKSISSWSKIGEFDMFWIQLD